jgi:uncharacterized protein (TIGR02217 family)
MAFYESPRFPDKISYGAEGGPGYSTDVVQTAGGYEFRNQNWTYPLHSWTVGHNARLDQDLAPLRKHYRAMKGRANTFRFKDWTDFRVPDNTGSGRFQMIDSTHFQMAKLYDNGSPQEVRKITKPISGTVTITGGTVLSIDYTTGIVTMTAGTPTDWVGQFDVPCRYDTDQMSEQVLNRHGAIINNELLVGWSGIRIVEIRI